jgi:hypothetical protein
MRRLRLGLVGACALVLVWSAAWAWQTTINGTANRLAQAHAVAVDGAGDVLAAGLTANRGSFTDFTVVKLGGTNGAEQWRAVLTGTQNRRDDQASAVAVDAAGDVVAAGWTSNAGSGLDFTVVKLAGASGTEHWRYVFNGPANGDDQAYAVAVDGAGDVLAAGATQTPGTSTDFTVVKLAGSSGTELWHTILNGPANSFDEAHAVAVDAAGDVVAAGLISHSSAQVDSFVIKLAGASGAEQWRAVLTGTAEGDDQASAVTIDAAGDVVAAGKTSNTGTRFLPHTDFTVIKRRGTDGGDF